MGVRLPCRQALRHPCFGFVGADSVASMTEISSWRAPGGRDHVGRSSGHVAGCGCGFAYGCDRGADPGCDSGCAASIGCGSAGHGATGFAALTRFCDSSCGGSCCDPCLVHDPCPDRDRGLGRGRGLDRDHGHDHGPDHDRDLDHGSRSGSSSSETCFCVVPRTPSPPRGSVLVVVHLCCGWPSPTQLAQELVADLAPVELEGRSWSHHQPCCCRSPRKVVQEVVPEVVPEVVQEVVSELCLLCSACALLSRDS